jgi:hypothetical protein
LDSTVRHPPWSADCLAKDEAAIERGSFIVILAANFARCRIHEMKSPTCGTGDGLVSVAEIFLGRKTLHSLTSGWAAVEKRWHKTPNTHTARTCRICTI